MLLVKNAEVYAPEYLGKKDVLICGGKIEKIQDEIGSLPVECEVLDAEGKMLTPGFIDQHVHITGGGGEGSFHTRTPELQLSELVENGITTVIGLLGTDGITRSVENLYAKTKALCEEGVSAYMLTGAYGYPNPTITGEVDRDIVFIDEILGVKLAISDHRAPNVTEEELIQIASKVRVAGMLSGKPGIVVLHMGDDEAGLQPVFRALEKTSIPTRIFRPTHVNRNEHLLEDGYEFLRNNVNLISIGNGTASKESEIFISDLLKEIDREVFYIMTNEAGASVYSASKLATEEFPQYDVALRSAVFNSKTCARPACRACKN